jgi:hypothetical protein
MLYKCPKCGRMVEAPPGAYYCIVCGPDARLVPLETQQGVSEKERAVKDIKSWIWSIYHAVEEKDWERLLKDNIFDHPRFKEHVRKAEPYFHGRLGEPLIVDIEALRRAIEGRDTTTTYQFIIEILLGLEPPAPWMH